MTDETNYKTLTPAKVWVLVIEHKHGTDIYVNATEERARKALYEYCAASWDEWMDKHHGFLKDLKRDDVIDAYFNPDQVALDPEWYILKEHQG